jgi:Ca2+:H+ antiporter
VRRETEERDERTEPEWSLRRSLGVLALAMAGAAAMSETITATIESFAELLHVSVFFVAAIVVAAAGNAAEHGTAVIVAARGELQLAANVALESAAQVAALVLPALLLVSFAIEPLPAAFRPVELIALGGGTALALALLAPGRSSRWRGTVLLASYAVVVAAFLLG